MEEALFLVSGLAGSAFEDIRRFPLNYPMLVVEDVTEAHSIVDREAHAGCLYEERFAPFTMTV